MRERGFRRVTLSGVRGCRRRACCGFLRSYGIQKISLHSKGLNVLAFRGQRILYCCIPRFSSAVNISRMVHEKTAQARLSVTVAWCGKSEVLRIAGFRRKIALVVPHRGGKPAIKIHAASARNTGRQAPAWRKPESGWWPTPDSPISRNMLMNMNSESNRQMPENVAAIPAPVATRRRCREWRRRKAAVWQQKEGVGNSPTREGSGQGLCDRAGRPGNSKNNESPGISSEWRGAGQYVFRTLAFQTASWQAGARK